MKLLFVTLCYVTYCGVYVTLLSITLMLVTTVTYEKLRKTFSGSYQYYSLVSINFTNKYNRNSLSYTG